MLIRLLAVLAVLLPLHLFAADQATYLASSELIEVREIPLSGQRENQQAFTEAFERARIRSQVFKKSSGPRLEAEVPSVRLQWPVRNSVGFDGRSVQSISNYLDLDTSSGGLEDWDCATGANARTYDGHNGLDIQLSPFSWLQMEQDAGIVVAAAAGIIVDKVGDQPERSCEANENGGTNNTVVIEHADGSYGLYAHMRTGSLTNKAIGDLVEAGDYLGVIGSAGISTGPHLHLSVGFFEGNQFVYQEPFAGSCNDINDVSWWETQPEYYESQILDARTHSASPVWPACPNTETPNYSDSFTSGDQLLFSATIRDWLEGEDVGLQVLMPNGNIFTAGTSTQDQQPHVTASTVLFGTSLPASAMAGEWTLRVTYKGEVVDHKFRVNSTAPEAPGLQASNNAYNGLWYDPALDGEGYNIVTSPVGTVIYFYGSDANGNRLWLVSGLLDTAFSDGGNMEIPMFESSGGTFAEPMGSSRGLAPWGTLSLGFSDCSNAVANLNGADGSKRSLLNKLAGVPGSNCVSASLIDESPWAGLWFDPTADGEGFNQIVTPFGTVVYYYGFDKNGDRLWLVTAPFEFSYQQNAQITVDLLRAGNGSFAAPDPNALETWGTLKLTGMTCNRIDYQLNTNDGNKFSAGQRLIGVVGLDCG